MPNLNVAVLGCAGYAKTIGKEGTQSDVILYNLKKGEDTVTLIEPVKYPEKLAPLFYTASMADYAIIVVDGITAEFGETVLMADCAGIISGCIILRNYIDKSQIAPLIKGTVLENYEFSEDDPIFLREMLLKEAASLELSKDDSPGTVSIDHHFNVKGIGTVILGTVVKGTIKVHDSLNVLPDEKTAQLRSIQKHDDDFSDAHAGDRVGLALKNISADDLDRGFVLTTDDNVKYTDTFSGEADIVKYWSAPIEAGMVIHLGHWMQYVSGRIESVSGNDPKKPEITLKLDKNIVYLPGDRAVIHQLDSGKLRVMGTVNLK
ncbi:EF-Tu/IF-2/RF-3 family GTPase [Methanoplanus endosymbiosus]|uniref:EF-Tu/IF-2/RF-3 family GTPase n=1 Tax=Methanoplanus endosymbiosus TaxID=33865 RepID=A0A9E7PNC0_9EURY|nr:EF-Tu/IF-2/RF-3 family GTPase [Methanoplanus endosymbiosus]UUX93439.1 EF-Tu/IF-2/RF-3 family GTPase [Methanoplanus endosymbiosus]